MTRSATASVLITLAALAAFTPLAASAQSDGIVERMRKRAAERAETQTENEAGERVDSTVDKGVDCLFNPVECAKKVPTATTPAGTPPAGAPGAPGTAPSADTTEWYAESQGKQVGPMPRAKLESMVTSGEVKAETLVWHAGLGAWTPAGSVEDLAHAFKKVPPPLPPRRSGPPPLPSR